MTHKWSSKAWTSFGAAYFIDIVIGGRRQLPSTMTSARSAIAVCLTIKFPNWIIVILHTTDISSIQKCQTEEINTYQRWFYVNICCILPPTLLQWWMFIHENKKYQNNQMTINMRLYLPKEVTVKQVFMIYWQNFTSVGFLVNVSRIRWIHFPWKKIEGQTNLLDFPQS